MADEARKRRDASWLGRLFARDHKAFAEFVDRYKETIFLCCRTLGLREDEIEDVASETFMAAYKGIGRYRGHAELSTWLWAIAYRQGVNYLRKESRGLWKNRRENQLLAEDDIQPANNGNRQALAGLESKEQTELVWEAVERLPKLWMMATVLFYREGKEVKEIAKIMQVRQNTVKTYLFRGRKRLKELLASGEDINVSR